MSIFHRIASILVVAGTTFQALIHQILVWFVRVVTVVTQVSVQVTAVVLQDNNVALTSQFVQKILAKGQNLETYSSIVSNTHLSVHNGW